MRVLLIQPPQITRGVISLRGLEIPLHLVYLCTSLEHPLETLKAYGYELENISDELFNYH